ncbi:DUF5318 family protein [Aestuariimicrobium ganziense]|uniref:DUF5318 family protein n=1 Tax=Aestuariimicrobium ganziense TaxID=2773677 RepID=UPI0019431CFA|nr:DUF5318 family protein [Aestuariimicrobium ganziense]
MQTRRLEVSHALQRRATLESLRRPQPTLSAPPACDADPILVRSALHHGDPAGQPCPVCEGGRLLVLHYIFGDQLGQYSGRIKSPAELDEMEHQFGEFTVRVVEVCPDCRWNHMIRTFVLGDGRKRRRPRREPTVEDIYG